MWRGYKWDGRPSGRLRLVSRAILHCTWTLVDNVSWVAYNHRDQSHKLKRDYSRIVRFIHSTFSFIQEKPFHPFFFATSKRLRQSLQFSATAHGLPKRQLQEALSSPIAASSSSPPSTRPLVLDAAL